MCAYFKNFIALSKLFGYDQGVMGVIVADQRFKDLMCPKDSWVTGAMASMYDIVGRIVLGYGVGGCAAGVPLCQSEIAPPTLRGSLIGIEQMVLCTSDLFAFWMKYAFDYLPTKDWWRLAKSTMAALPIHEPLILATGDVGIALFIRMMLAMVGIAVLQWHAGENPGSKGNYATVVFPYLFYVFFNISSGVAVWTYPSEIFPLSMRAKGNAFATSASWTMCYIVAQASPPIADAIGWGLYVVYAAICVIGFIFVRFALVETRNRSLEDMNRLFCLEGYFAASEAAAAEQTFAAKDTSVEHIERSSNVAGPA
ncbi:hypothetical protein ETB97_010974 [Aspergillus alliaceus]|uniref:Major facilitator superfamily (MFS) profile domain-containing protein n=1 Tax=Petromyces alliaceus TaxID=209559 RepID=A0A8H6ABP6_PETAA|nr:hypothetical protein ETB97_010974 [Aspergillus burnettii]